MRNIDSIKDCAFEALRKSRTQIGRLQTQCFVIETEEMIRQCIDSGYSIKGIYITKNPPNWGDGLPFYRISSGMMAKVFPTETPDVVALAEKKEVKLSSFATAPLLLILDRIQNSNNIGMILRSAEAFNVHGALVIPHPTSDFYDRNVVKTSMGSFFRIPVCHTTEDEAISFCKSHGISLISTKPDAQLALSELEQTSSNALIVGNETTGISSSFQKHSDKLIAIPMTGKIQSLNVLVATSISLYHLFNQGKK